MRGKAFTGDLRHRPSGTLLVLEHLGADGSPHLRIDAGELRADLTLSTCRPFHGQELGLLARIEVAAGWHVYGTRAPQPYVPLSIEFPTDEPSIVARSDLQVPTGEPLHLPAAGATLPVLEGRFELRGRLRLRWSPPESLFPEMAEAVRSRSVRAGEHLLRGVLRFQACSDTSCLEPVATRFSLPIAIQDHVPAGDPAAASGADVDE